MDELAQLTPEERLNAYNLITAGCSHIYSKGQMQEDKALAVLNSLVPLIKNDPYFLAHLTSYALLKTKNKDLQVFTTYVNSLSSADGTPFSPNSKYVKPNLRFVSAAAVQQLDLPLALRTLTLANNFKYAVPNYLNESYHMPTALRTAFKRYLKYREINPSMLRGAKKAGLAATIRRMYKILRIVPEDDVAKIIYYKKRGAKLDYDKGPDFTNLTDLEVAQKIRAEHIPPLGVFPYLDRTISPVIAVALLEQSTGNMAVILRRTFDEAGVLNEPEVMELYQQKIATAKTALDRAETLSQDASVAVKNALKTATAAKRKEELEGVGKVWLHVDVSGSMSGAIEVAKDKGAIIAEMVPNPTENFRWGLFNDRAWPLELPDEFVKDAFAAKLFGAYAAGGTNCYAMYEDARRFGAEADVFISDGGHNEGDLTAKIEHFHSTNPNLAKPKACVIVTVGSRDRILKNAYERAHIPVVEIDPQALSESALVAEAIKTAMLGPVQIVDDILNTELLNLPDWYYTI